MCSCRWLWFVTAFTTTTLQLAIKSTIRELPVMSLLTADVVTRYFWFFFSLFGVSFELWWLLLKIGQPLGFIIISVIRSRSKSGELTYYIISIYLILLTSQETLQFLHEWHIIYNRKTYSHTVRQDHAE